MQVIADITKRMGAGMAEFVSKDLGQGTTSTAEYDKYCHFVAGLVGDGLTRLFVATGIEGQELLLAPELANRCAFIALLVGKLWPRSPSISTQNCEGLRSSAQILSTFYELRKFLPVLSPDACGSM